jgi:hypothetical protein
MYLRNFADESERLMLVDRDDASRRIKTSVKSALVEVGFYRIEADDLAREEDRIEHDPESIEEALSGFEGAAAAVIKVLVSGGTLDELGPEDWYALFMFVSLQTVRGHRWRNDFAAVATQSARVSTINSPDGERIEEWLQRRGEPSGPADMATFREQLAAGPFPRLVPPQAVLVQESLRSWLGNPDDDDDLGIWQYLAGKKVELIRPSGTPVLTSDEPVCWWSPGDHPVDYASAGVVWMPLSRHLIIQFREPQIDLVACGLPDLKTQAGHDAMATEVNRLIGAQAERWIVHHPDDAPLENVELPPSEC